MFLNILSSTAFGNSFETDGKDYKLMSYLLRNVWKEFAQRIIFWEYLPIFRTIDRKNINHISNIYKEIKNSFKSKFISHYKTYDETVVRDFCDTLIGAKNDALNEGKESAPHLTDDNLASAIFDMVYGGVHSSSLTFEWLLLLSLYYPKIGHKLRQEIDTQIGDRMPTHEDRNRCHYVMAFIAETLRFRNVVPPGAPHCASAESKIGEYTIPKGTTVFVYAAHILMDEKCWPNPDEFNPDRFIENGQFMTTRPSAYIPFSVGRRVCVGEKLAIADLFLVLVRFMQKTNEYNICLHSNNGIEIDPNLAEFPTPLSYEIVFKKK